MIRNLFGGTITKCRTIDKLDIFGDGSGVALYRFDGNANDESGNYHGTETDINYGGGVYERGAIFNGTTSRILTSLVCTNTTSISFWINSTKVNGVSGIFGYTPNYQGSYAYSDYVLLNNDLGGNGSWSIQLPSGEKICQNLDTWYHVVIVSSAASPLKIYINNVLRTNLIATNRSLNGFKIDGLGYYNGINDGLIGLIDQLRVFNKSLSAQEVATLYAECEPTSIVDNINPFEDGSLKALYKFDDDATDATGVYNGTATNVTYGTGRFGNCAVFGGSTVNAKITSPYAFPSGGNAISVWAKVDSSNQGEACLFGYLSTARLSFLRADYNLLSAGAWMHRLPSGEKVCTNLDEWYHIVYTSNGSEPLKLYVNGVLRTNLIATNFNWNTFAIDGLGFYITSYTDNLTGKLDQLRIFNKALTPLEVASLYNETTPMEEPMSVQVDPFKDGSGKALYRLEGNALDESGNYNGTATSVTYTSGRFGRCGVFNGTSTRINASFANFASTGVTVSMWVKITAHKNYNYLANFYENNNFTIYSDTSGNISLGGAITSGAYTAGQWLHVVGTITIGGFATLYINGSSVGTTTNATWFADTNRNDTFGCSNPSLGTYSSYLNGSIDQVRIFNRALTQSEVTALYNEI